MVVKSSQTLIDNEETMSFETGDSATVTSTTTQQPTTEHEAFQYYDQLMMQLTTGNHCHQSSTTTSNPVNAYDKSWMQPSNVPKIVRFMDRDVKKYFRVAIVTLYTILYNSHRYKVIAKRKQTLIENRNRAPPPKTNNGNVERITRFDTIPTCFYECSSNVSKISVVLFLTIGQSESMKRKLIVCILNGAMSQMSITEIVELCQLKNIDKLRTFLKSLPANTTSVIASDSSGGDNKVVKKVIRALIEIAELLREKVCSKLALELNLRVYVDMLNEYLANNKLHTTAACDAIIEKYLKECVALSQQRDERHKIYKEFMVDHRVISKLALELPQLKQNNSKHQQLQQHQQQQQQQNGNGGGGDDIELPAVIPSEKFNDSDQFEVYEGTMNYTKNLVWSCFKHNNKTYRIITYNDSLYDVIGAEIDEYNCLHQQYQQQQQQQPSELYSRKTWRERLEMIPYRTKVFVREMNGQELNQYNHAATLTLSWMDKNGYNNMKTITFTKNNKRVKKQQKQQEATASVAVVPETAPVVAEDSFHDEQQKKTQESTL